MIWEQRAGGRGRIDEILHSITAQDFVAFCFLLEEAVFLEGYSVARASRGLL